ncbi:MAG: hypothetical protein GF381_03900 [Candidatus Pacebacteria bacterium]|nr:hypothetical protein [Candidatus Paceibacterota bacterium]
MAVKFMQVSLIAAISADGFIAQQPDQASVSWTSQADKKFFAELTRQIGVVVMGRRTFATIGHPLSDRLNLIYTRQSRQVLLEEFNLDLNLSRDRLQVTQLEPQELVAQAARQGFGQLAVCGGASIYRQFIQAGVVDQVYLTVEPVFFGQGIALFDQELAVDLELVESRQLNDKGTMLLHYQLKTI